MPDTAQGIDLTNDAGATLVAALAGLDFDRLADAFAPDVRMRALTPRRRVDLSGADRVAAQFATWFGETELELVQAASHEVGDRLHISYRFRVKEPGSPSQIVEQHLFCAPDEGRIAILDLMCSGFRPEVSVA